MTKDDAKAIVEAWLAAEGWHGSEFNSMAEGPLTEFVLAMVKVGRSEAFTEAINATCHECMRRSIVGMPDPRGRPELRHENFCHAKAIRELMESKS